MRGRRLRSGARRGPWAIGWGLGALFGLAPGARVVAQTPAPRALEWHPARVLEGVVAELVVRVDSRFHAESIHAVVAGEPLHFARDAETSFAGLVPVPLGSRDTLDVTLVAWGAAGADTLTARVPVRRRVSEVQVLRHLPAPYDRPPDSAAVARIAEDSALLDTIGRRAHEGPRLWHAAFLRPVSGRVTTAFAAARRINDMVEPRHEGVDLAGTKGSRVRATNRGTVALAGPLYETGLTVVLDHGAGLITIYGHLSSATVSVGDTVERGQVIGRVGATGRATGPHLHWGAFYGALPVDPLSLLALQPLP